MLSYIKMSDTKVTPRNLASQKFPMKLLCEIAGAILDGKTGKMLEYRHLRIIPKYQEMWVISFRNEIGILAQGISGQVEGKNTLLFVDKNNVPQNRRGDVTYSRI